MLKDERFSVIAHPRVGKTLVAARDITKGEVSWYWGAFRAGANNIARNDYEVAVRSPDGLIDPTPYPDSMLQFANAPGPGEIPNVKLTSETTHADGLCAVKVRAIVNIPRGHQITWRYGSGYFESRNIQRVAIHLPSHPARTRARRVVRAASRSKMRLRPRIQ